MYPEMKKIIKMSSFSFAASLRHFLSEDGKHPFHFVAQSAQKFKNKNKVLLKHAAKKSNTQKWRKKHEEIHRAGIEIFFSLMASVSSAHQSLHFSLLVLYACENNHKDLLVIEKEHSELTTNFGVLCRSLDVLDSTDVNNFLLMNKMRNILCHLPVSETLNLFTHEFLDELVDLASSIDSTVEALMMSREDKAVALLKNSIEIYLDESDYIITNKESK